VVMLMYIELHQFVNIMPNLQHRPWRKYLNPSTITLLYLIGGGLWIQFSDNWAHGLTQDPGYLSQIQTYKGWFYILMTGAILYFLISKHRKYVAESSQLIRDTQRQFEHIYLYNPYPMIVVDPESENIVTMNSAFSKYLPHDKRRETISLVSVFNENVVAEIRKRIESQKDKTLIGLFNSRGNFSDPKLIELSGFTLKMNQKVTWLLILHDVTEEVNSRNQMIELSQSLERKVHDRTLELRIINDELEAFSYSVSHDLRAPLRAIDGFSLAVIEEFGKSLDNMALHYLNRVRAATQKMSELIDDMTRLSRISRTSVALEPLNLSVMCAQITSDQLTLYPDVKFSVNIQSDMHVSSDRGLTNILLGNLIGNAFKYSSKHPAPVIDIGTTSEAGIIEFFVRDNGIGFDMQYVDKVFKPFQRLHEAVDYQGTGIGLATVQRVISKLGGTIRAESTPGKGSTFYFSLSNSI
jgi:signal transduction histidine kinase